MPPAEFEPTVSAGERSQTQALDRAATTVDWSQFRYKIFKLVNPSVGLHIYVSSIFFFFTFIL